MRGEDVIVMPIRHKSTETPPRAWGRQEKEVAALNRMRNTPTCVGKTVSDAELAELLWKHPHVRGEDSGLMDFGLCV